MVSPSYRLFAKFLTLVTCRVYSSRLLSYMVLFAALGFCHIWYGLQL